MSYKKIKINHKTQKNKTWNPEQIKAIWIFLGDLFLISLSTQFFLYDFSLWGVPGFIFYIYFF